MIRAGLVHGAGGGGTMGLLLSLARREGGPFVIGEGWNVWSAVHRDDLAELYVRALERAPAGSLFHAASGDRVSMREIAAAGARAIGRFDPVRSLPVEEARAVAGAMAEALAADKRISAHHAREVLGWIPRGPSLVEEIERGSYAPASAAPATAEATGSARAALTMINAFEVPVAATERFVADWSTDLAFMREQPGFVSGTLYRADSDGARFRYINVAHWRQREDFHAAQASLQQRFQAEKVDRHGGWRSLGITMNAATFQTDRTF